MSPHSEISLTNFEGEVLVPPNRADDHNIKSKTSSSTFADNLSTQLKKFNHDCVFDLICVGFGPASLAVAVALHDAIASGRKLFHDGPEPKVLFLEKQSHFAWHSGMLLPGAKMQISFIKDLATLRNPQSQFTFLNYLHQQQRLVDFTNLGTFLPTRAEYEDYLRWCSSFFNHLVEYNQQVVGISASQDVAGGSAVNLFSVHSRDVHTGAHQAVRGRNILIATGGQPSIPENLPQKDPRVIHSSQFAHQISHLLPKKTGKYKIAVIGAGQSAAEIFQRVQTLYPSSETSLIMRQEFLRPSDDSPFVNSVFNPEYTDTVFSRSAAERSALLEEARATNYGVVRLELIEAIFERMYEQRRELGPDQGVWPHRILGNRYVTKAESSGGAVKLSLQHTRARETTNAVVVETEELEADLVVVATGYRRIQHVDMLKDVMNLLPSAMSHESHRKGSVTGWYMTTDEGERRLSVGRDYRVQFLPGSVSNKAGIWLQGCCEGTHGLSDTLLSVLAVRSGQIVDSIFGTTRCE